MRGTSVNYTGALTFTYATTGPDIFKKEDVQGLAQAVEQHNHTAGKGLSIVASIKTAVDMPDWFRSTGHTSAFAGSGVGVELYYDATQGGTLQAINRAGGATLPLWLGGSTITLSYTNGNTQFSSAGDATMTGALTLGKGLYVNAGIIYLGPQASPGDTYIQRGSAGIVQVNNTIQISAGGTLSFAVNGYNISGVSGQALLMTNASFQVAGGSLYLDSAATPVRRVYWDGSNIRSNVQFYVDGQINATGDIIANGAYVHAKGGTYYAGPTDQSTLQMWNPGEWRISSSPGNLYAVGGITAEGAPVTGKGAYINSASSETLKKNITTLDPDACLAQVLDERARPVSFEYIEPLPQLHVPQDSLEAPLQPIDWTPERLGFIAEEVARVVPQAAGIVDGTTLAHGLSTEALVPILWGAVRALSQRIETLEGASA